MSHLLIFIAPFLMPASRNHRPNLTENGVLETLRPRALVAVMDRGRNFLRPGDVLLPAWPSDKLPAWSLAGLLIFASIL